MERGLKGGCLLVGGSLLLALLVAAGWSAGAPGMIASAGARAERGGVSHTVTAGPRAQRTSLLP